MEHDQSASPHARYSRRLRRQAKRRQLQRHHIDGWSSDNSYRMGARLYYAFHNDTLSDYPAYPGRLWPVSAAARFTTKASTSTTAILPLRAPTSSTAYTATSNYGG